MKPKLVAFTGAGISAESGIQTFRGTDGLWNDKPIADVATLSGWHKNKQLVLDFYNDRRSELANVNPNQAHLFLSELENHCDVTIITQNVDDLHERANSSKIIHLHGELTKARIIETDEVVDIGYANIVKGQNLRPHIVWFDENVFNFNEAKEAISEADIVLVIGSTLIVQPAASLLRSMPKDCELYVVDPNENPIFSGTKLVGDVMLFNHSAGLRQKRHKYIQKTAVNAVEALHKDLIKV